METSAYLTPYLKILPTEREDEIFTLATDGERIKNIYFINRVQRSCLECQLVCLRGEQKMEQASSEENVTLALAEYYETHLSQSHPRHQHQDQVNWITTLAPLIAITALLFIGSLSYCIIRRRTKSDKKGIPDPAVCMDPDPTRDSDVHIRFLSD